MLADYDAFYAAHHGEKLREERHAVSKRRYPASSLSSCAMNFPPARASPAF
jgi:hypothetical protein